MQKYNPQKIEQKWQKIWEKSGAYKTKDMSRKPKFYALDFFPYPSGEGLHVGHTKGYIATDAVSRMKMMEGFNILHPMGWDAFGLPAENYAIKHKIHPRIATEKNIANFTKQMHKIGFTYDWDREINTTDPEFYKWTQWIFLKMFEHGLAYESDEPVNWCPSCKTVLAFEDLEKGLCERCGTQVVQKKLRQWVLKITAYADRLLHDLDSEELDWEDLIIEQQKNWIGQSEGAEVEFPIVIASSVIARSACLSGRQGATKQSLNPEERVEIATFSASRRIARNDKKIKVYTTRLDTIFGCTYCVIAPEHKLIQDLRSEIKNYPEIEKYIIQAQNKTNFERTELAKEKTGVELRGIKAINPFTKEEIPVWAADYVLGFYGTGAVMAVPAHDERDFEFAKKYNLPIKEVIESPDGRSSIEENAYTEDGVLVNSGKYTGLTSAKAREGMTKWLEEQGIGGKKVNYKMRDWVFSRQRYWGEPIPLIFCEHCKKIIESATLRQAQGDNNKKAKDNNNVMVSLSNHDSQKNKVFKIQNLEFSLGEILNPGWIEVSDKDLPVKLPEVKSYEPTGTGESPLAKITEWVNVPCPKCGGPGRRETNTMPQWAGSSWYYLRYIDPKNKKSLIDKNKEKYWMPVDLYVGGAEHATRHLLYARFWHKFLYDIKVVSTKEPFKRLVHVGLISGEDGRKMSKRWGNVINPDDVVAQFGADTLRLYEMFMGPFTQNIAWSTKGANGMRRFLDRVWQLNDECQISDVKSMPNDKTQILNNLERLSHKTIKKVGEDIENFKFNTAISALMVLSNEFEKSACGGSAAGGQESKVFKRYYSTFLILLSPFAPHISEELWHELGREKSIFLEPWPKYDPKLVKEEEVEMIIQVNGKLKDKIKVAADISEEEAKKLALGSEKIKKAIEGKEMKKVIFVKERLINLVIQ